MEKESFGARLRRVRTARGMSQAELASVSGLNVKHISDLERDRYGKRVRGETVRKLAKALHVHAVWLEHGYVEEFPAPAEDDA